MTDSPDAPEPVRLLELALRDGPHRREVDAAIARVLDSEHFIHGPEVTAFEDELAAFLGGEVSAVGVSNGSDALVLALMAVGLGPGDEVVVPAFTYAATATSVALLGGRPIFVDVAEPALNLDLDAALAAVTPRTRAVIPVHLYGRALDWAALEADLARSGRDDVALIEDAAQALGARFEGRAVGTLGDLACFSFFPTKNLGAFGDAGAVTSRSPEHASRLRRLRNQGRTGRDDHDLLGMNARLDALQAAILRTRLPHLDGWIAARRANARFYREGFEELVTSGVLGLPPEDDAGARTVHTYHQFCLRVRDGRRDALRAALTAAGIETAVYYTRPVPEQRCFESLGHRRGEFPVAEAAAADSLAIPVHPNLSAVGRERVAAQVRAFFGQPA